MSALAQAPGARRRFASARPSDALLGSGALAVLLLCSLLLVLIAASGPTRLVPRSEVGFPGWLAGPLHPLARGISVGPDTTGYVLSFALLAMTLAYIAAVASAPALRVRLAIGAIVALHAIWLMAPLMPITDLFNYLSYARLEVVHGLSPYTHVLAEAPADPAVQYATWRHLHTPYGPLFTLASSAVGWLPLPVAYWALKSLIVAASLGCVALTWRCARQLGRPPLRPVLLLIANPLVLVYGLGGFHNDVLMLLPLLGAVSLVLARRDGLAGAAGVAAVAVKASAGVLLPFLLLGSGRRGRFAAGAVLAAVLVAAVTVAVLGPALPNLGDQNSLVTPWSIPDVIGQIAGLGGAPPWMRHLAPAIAVAVLLVLLVQTWRGRIPWLDACGWATLTLILSLTWLVPWYVLWLLPFAGLASSPALRRSAFALTLYLTLTFMPLWATTLNAVGYNPFDSAVGRAMLAAGHRLAH